MRLRHRARRCDVGVSSDESIYPFKSFINILNTCNCADSVERPATSSSAKPIPLFFSFLFIHLPLVVVSINTFVSSILVSFFYLLSCMLINIRFHRSIRLTIKKEVAFLPHGGPTYREIVHVFIAIKKERRKKNHTHRERRSQTLVRLRRRRGTYATMHQHIRNERKSRTINLRVVTRFERIVGACCIKRRVGRDFLPAAANKQTNTKKCGRHYPVPCGVWPPLFISCIYLSLPRRSLRTVILEINRQCGWLVP